MFLFCSLPPIWHLKWELIKVNRLFVIRELIFIILAYLVYDGSSDQHSDFVKNKTNGGVQAAIVTVPLVSAYEQALQSLKQGGRLVLIGIPTDKLSISIGECIAKQIQIVGSMVGTRTDLKEALDIAHKYHIQCRVQTCQLEQINEIFDQMKNYRLTGRMVIDFTDQSK
jgi:propanol-preferring alcohol dehydrogenase